MLKLQHGACVGSPGSQGQQGGGRETASEVRAEVCPVPTSSTDHRAGLVPWYLDKQFAHHHPATTQDHAQERSIYIQQGLVLPYITRKSGISAARACPHAHTQMWQCHKGRHTKGTKHFQRIEEEGCNRQDVCMCVWGGCMTMTVTTRVTSLPSAVLKPQTHSEQHDTPAHNAPGPSGHSTRSRAANAQHNTHGSPCS